MTDQKIAEMKEFCETNSNSAIIEKYSRYFKDGFDGYGIEQKTFEKQRNIWIEKWKDEMTLEDNLNLADNLFQTGRYEEKSLAIALVQSKREHYTRDAFKRIGN